MKIISVLFICTLFTACSTQKVLKTDSQSDIDLSGKWNETDAEIAADELYNNLLTSSWLKNQNAESNLKPRIEVLAFDGNFKNGGETLEKYLLQFLNEDTTFELINDSNAQKSAQFQLTGNIEAEEFITEDQKYIDYFVKVQLFNLSSQLLWEDETVIKKYLKN
jgi:hypothetical protein